MKLETRYKKQEDEAPAAPIVLYPGARASRLHLYFGRDARASRLSYFGLISKLLEFFKYCCSTHTAADTHGHNTISAADFFEIGNACGCQFGTGAS